MIAYSIAFLIYCGLLVLGWFVIPSISAQNFVPIFVGWIAAVTALFGTAVTAITARITTKANERAEDKKHARSQTDALSTEQHADTHEAINGMLTAMSQWYAALARLEGGDYDAAALSAAQAEMDKAQGLGRVDNSWEIWVKCGHLSTPLRACYATPPRD